MKKNLLLLLAIFYSFGLMAQDKIISDSKLLEQHLQKNSYDIDPKAKAIVLFEKATAIMRDGVIKFEYEKAVKILSKEVASSVAEVSILRQNSGNIRKIRGTSYNIENNAVIKQVIEKGDVLNDKIIDGLNALKFNIPAVKEGTIIHYSYISEAPFWINIPSWEFQNEYPTLFSQYEVVIPKYIVYTPIERMQIPLKYVQKESQLLGGDACTYSGIYNHNEKYQTWVRKNIEAFENEPFMLNKNNIIERVKFQVQGLDNQRKIIGLYNNWKDVSKNYYYENDNLCGQVFNNNGFLDETIQEIIAGKTSDLEKAKAIFNYVKNTYRPKMSTMGNIASYNIKEIFNKKEGTKQGINLLLSAMLIKAGFLSEPVLMATKSSERLNPIFPEPENVNYIISRLTLDNKQYCLDATDKNLPFGTLLPECYNGYCRIVNKNGDEMELNSDMIQNKSISIVKLEPKIDLRKMKLIIDKQMGVFSSYKLRNEWTKDTSEIRKNIANEIQSLTYPGALIDLSVKNLNNPESPLSIHYVIEFDFDFSVNSIFLDPYFTKVFTQNPFNSKHRRNGIEMDYKEDISYILNFQIPNGYIIDDFPESKVIKYGENNNMVMKNIMNYDDVNRTFSLNSRFTTNATSFSVAEYDNVRTFYENVASEQNKKIVLTKTN